MSDDPRSGLRLQRDGRVIWLASAGSTNSEAMTRALAGEELPFWLGADIQTTGRGRAGRSWLSLPGNLAVSYALPLRTDLSLAGQLALVAGLGLVEAARRVAGPGQAEKFSVKWPNDVLAGGGKCGGILIETTTIPRSGIRFAVIGFGFNLAAAPTELDREVSCAAAFGVTCGAPAMLGVLMETMAEALGNWSEGTGFAIVRSQWLGRSLAVGTPVTVETGEGKLPGLFAGIDDDGALLLDDGKGTRRRITFGDVTAVGSGGRY